MHGCSGGACVVARGEGACTVAGWGGMCVHGCSGGWHAWLLLGCVHGCTWGGVRGCSQGEGVCVVAPGGHAWDMTRYRDTINERAVRILLECILV